MSFKFTWKYHIVWAVIALSILFFVPSFKTAIQKYCQSGYALINSGNNALCRLYNIVLIMAPLLMIREAVHGILYRLFGGIVRYGIKRSCSFTVEISELPLKKAEFLLIILSPLTVISLICIIMPAEIGGMIYYLNLIVSAGDIYTAFSLFSVDSEARIVDKSYGYDIIRH
jgi:hypothetical protein